MNTEISNKLDNERENITNSVSAATEPLAKKVTDLECAIDEYV